MSKSRHKNRRPKKPVKPAQTNEPGFLKKHGKNILIFAVIVLAAGIPFGLGKYFEFNSPDPFDSGANVYSAAHILDGAEIGIEEKPSAMISTLLVNILGVWLFGFNETGPKIMQMLFQASAIILMFLALYRLSGKLPAAAGVILTSIYLSSPLIAKYGNDKTQYLTAFMIMGISCFVLYQLSNKWWWALLAGGFLGWAPLFKPVGASAMAAVGLFVILQPILKNRTITQTGIDILWLFAGAAAAIAPLYIWIIGWNVRLALPYKFVWDVLQTLLPNEAGGGQAKGTVSYVATARKLVSFSTQWRMVLRYYVMLILPVTLAVGSIVVRLGKLLIVRFGGAVKEKAAATYDRFVLLFAVWWILDMAFVWISPRSYEQYYLPLTASASMLGGYIFWLYRDKLNKSSKKQVWIIVGSVSLIIMVVMSWHVFFGISTSPYSGAKYRARKKGYSQTFRDISRRRKQNLQGYWEYVSDYIRENSQPTDKIYVWGWYPGIYVQAQRFSSASKAFMMPRPAPARFEQAITNLLREFEERPPKFIVDSRKPHIPTHWPPMELWPILPRGFARLKKEVFLPKEESTVTAFDKAWSDMLRTRCDDAEADRYELLKPFRQFVMENYEIAETQDWINLPDGRLVHRLFGTHVVFKI